MGILALDLQAKALPSISSGYSALVLFSILIYLAAPALD